MSQKSFEGRTMSNTHVARRWAPPLVALAAAAAIGALVACGSSDDDNAAKNDGNGSQAGDAGPTESFGTSEAGTGDSGEQKCATLNIGIIGVPGEEASANFQDWLARAGTTATRVQTDEDDVLTSDVLAPFDVVVFDHLKHTHSAAEVTAFQTWLAAGKGAVSMTGYLDAPSVDFLVNPLLAPLGVAYTGEHRNGPATNFADHPITKGLTEITFLGGYDVQRLDGATAQITPLASIPEHGDDPIGNAGFAVQLGQGRAFVWGDEWIEFDSEWTTLPQVEQLWVQAFQWLAPTRCKLNPVK